MFVIFLKCSYTWEREMHPGIFKGPESTQVSSDADSMNGQFRERIENISGFQVHTWLDAFSELEQYSGSD